jgi:hypothetical protein
MRIVVASEEDQAARALVAHWGVNSAALVTPADLSRPGWRHVVGDPAQAMAAVDGRVLHAEDIEAVVVRLFAVSDYEIPHMRSEDRQYAAAEMTAFLLAWLDECRCPVLNRPTAGCLNGPSWSPEQWMLAAARAGLRTVAMRRRVPPNGPMPPTLEPDEAVATVVEDQCLGPIHDDLVDAVFHLAAIAGTTLLSVRLTDSSPTAAFLGASAWPNLADPSIMAALDTYLEAAC